MNSGGNKEDPNSKALYDSRQLANIAARWDTKAQTWDSELTDPLCHLNEDNAYDRFLAVAKLLVEQKKDYCTGHGLIDAGCATGLVLAHVISAFSWGVGIDISPHMISAARAKNIPNATFLVGDCFELAAIAPKAGAIFSRGVLLSHYGPQHAKALLQSARKALLSGGFLLCDFLNFANRSNFEHVPENKTYFVPAEVCSLAMEAGFASARIAGEQQRRVQLLIAEINP